MGEHGARGGTSVRGGLASDAASGLQGLVDVCIDRPQLALDRPFTYRVPDDLTVQLGSLVKVRFGRAAVAGWVLGPADETPPRVSSIQKVVSAVPLFDQETLTLCRRIAERAVAPLSTILGRAIPERVLAEEKAMTAQPPQMPPRVPSAVGPHLLAGYGGGTALLGALRSAEASTFTVRPGSGEEHSVVLEAVAACVAAGRSALVLLPEADPEPATARALVDAFPDVTASLLGGSTRLRYRTWLRVRSGAYQVVIGTRSTVYAPVPDLGLIWIQREAHEGHREERMPRLHVRDIALLRQRAEPLTLVCAGRCVSVEASDMGATSVAPRGRSWPPVQVAKPGPEGRAPVLVSALRKASSAFLFEPRRGYGMAAICRSCGAAAACPSCGSPLRSENGIVRCVACESIASCAHCGGTTFGLRRGGRERVEEWVQGLLGERAARVHVGGASDVRDVIYPGYGLVGILDADLLLARQGIAARERAVATWMDAVGWAREDGMAIVQTERSNAPEIQSLVAGDPSRFHRAERARRAEAGFPIGALVFRVEGLPAAMELIRGLEPFLFLESAAGEGSRPGARVCLVSLRPQTLPAFADAMRHLARHGDVQRVDAEPHR